MVESAPRFLGSRPSCCSGCTGPGDRCLNTDCPCHRIAAASQPDLEALAVQVEASREHGEDALAVARLALVAALRDPADALLRETRS